jgi:hypothetical protein
MIARAFARLRTRRVMATAVRALVTVMAAAAFVGCGESSELSGTWEAALPDGVRARIVFADGNKAKVSLLGEGPGEELTHNTVYTKTGNKLHFTTDEPMGVPMNLVYENGVLSDGAGMVFTKK